MAYSVRVVGAAVIGVGEQAVRLLHLSADGEVEGRAPAARCLSSSRAIRTIASTDSHADRHPTAVSAESITASVPSRIAFATSEASARVGRGAWTIDSSIWVAVMTGLPWMFGLADQPLLGERHLLEGQLDTQVAPGHHDGVGRVAGCPRMFCRAVSFSILAMIRTEDGTRRRSASTSSPRCTNDIAM